MNSQLLSVLMDSSLAFDALEGLDLAAGLDVLGVAPFDNLDGNTGTMAMGVDDTNSIAGYADLIAPTECWLQQPAPFDPNADPTVNLNYGGGPGASGPPAPGSTSAPGQQFNQLQTSSLYQFSLQNLTNYGADHFTVGDQFKLSTDGVPLAQIHVHSWKDGTDFGDTAMGQADQFGHFEVGGNMTPDMAGAWSEEWYGNDVLIQTVAFFVIAADQ